MYKKVALGSGKRYYGEDWLHIDNAKFHHTRQYDIFNLPFEDNLCELLYACHLIAYFDRQEIVPILKEWYRVLKPGGILRIATPDFGAICMMYQTTNTPLKNMLGPLYGKMQMNDVWIYHKTCYDYEALRNILQQADFGIVSRYDHKATETANIDDHSAAYINGTLISLNIEAVK